MLLGVRPLLDLCTFYMLNKNSPKFAYSRFGKILLDFKDATPRLYSHKFLIGQVHQNCAQWRSQKNCLNFECGHRKIRSKLDPSAKIGRRQNSKNLTDGTNKATSHVALVTVKVIKSLTPTPQGPRFHIY